MKKEQVRSILYLWLSNLKEILRSTTVFGFLTITYHLEIPTFIFEIKIDELGILLTTKYII